MLKADPILGRASGVVGDLDKLKLNGERHEGSVFVILNECTAS